MYAEEMSKLTTELGHHKKIQDNLHTLNAQEEKNIKEQQEHLRNKMASIEKKRNKNM